MKIVCYSHTGLNSKVSKVVSKSPNIIYHRNPLCQRFPNWWVARRFMVGSEKFLKRDFFNYIKIKNLKKWESEKKIRKG
jgi:hypothetical protein